MYFLINGEVFNESFIQRVTPGFLSVRCHSVEFFIAQNDWQHPRRGLCGSQPDVFLITLGDGKLVLLTQQWSANDEQAGEYERMLAWVNDTKEATKQCSPRYTPPPPRPERPERPERPAPPQLTEEEQYQARIKQLEKQVDF